MCCAACLVPTASSTDKPASLHHQQRAGHRVSGRCDRALPLAAHAHGQGKPLSIRAFTTPARQPHSCAQWHKKRAEGCSFRACRKRQSMAQLCVTRLPHQTTTKRCTSCADWEQVLHTVSGTDSDLQGHPGLPPVCAWQVRALKEAFYRTQQPNTTNLQSVACTAGRLLGPHMPDTCAW